DFQILGGRYSGARVVIETVCNLFESGSYESAKKILSYFVNIGLPINGNVFSSNAIIIITNMGENISLNTKVELITYLLNECGADLNTKVYDATDSNVVTNPVCNILGLGDKKLIEFVLRKGGDLLYFAPNEVIVINGSLSVEEEIKILHIIEEYMIEQIEKEIASVSVENVLEEEKESSSITSDETPIAKSEEEPESITVSSVDKCIEKYAAFKEWESKNSNISQEESLKSKIDLLVLKCIKDEVNREDYVNQIDELLSENPELHGYSVTAALHNNISQSDAGEIFARKQQLLHEFCMRRKELVNAERDPNEKAIDNVLGENIYKIHTSENFKNLCFFKLPENHCIEESKLLSVGFVGRSSTGENGIKLHKNGCTRLKVDGSDKAYYSNECLVDKDFENLIYIFGCFLNHEAGRYIINSHQPIEKHYISHEDFCSILSGQTEFHCEELSNF
ncbi:MAG: hypothetical protein KA998_00610, partial [Rickettsiaceae bacterium]|nr:hypothetical protein [Rickettsiaceae bacterium]